MNCKVVISGATDAETVKTSGDLVPETGGRAGFRLTYTINGDNCLLVCRGSTVTQSRRGRVNTDITFARGKNTVCMLLSGELTGSVPVKTLRLESSLTEQGAELVIDYFLGGAQISLRLWAEYIKEQS